LLLTPAMAAQAIEDLAFAEDKKKYIVDVLDPILEQMVQELLAQVPEDPTDFMIAWLRKRSGVAPQAGKETLGVKSRNARLRRELHNMSEVVDGAVLAAGQGQDGAANKDDDSDDEDDDEDDDAADDFVPPQNYSRGPRASVSAEAYGQWNKVKAFTPPQHPKSDAVSTKIRDILCNSFMFSNLEPKDMDVVVLAMVERTFEAGTRIIKEGDDGQHLYVIEVGSPICKKVIGGEEKVVKTCQPGDVFGELALLYNCPRAATVEAVDQCKAWELDRETFNHIVKDAATKKFATHDAFLQKVSLFSTIDAYERAQVCDALKTETYKKGEPVVKQGEEGNTFYIVEEGTLVAVKDVPGKGPQEVLKYSPGDYFGELALLKNQPRAATVQVSSEGAKVLSLDRKSFVKMLGPVQDILKRKQSEYV